MEKLSAKNNDFTAKLSFYRIEDKVPPNFMLKILKSSQHLRWNEPSN